VAGVVDWERLLAHEPYPGVLARRFDTVHATIVRYELAPDARYPLHDHPEEQLVHHLGGRLALRLGGRELVLAQCDLVHVPANLPHAARNIGPDTAIFLNIVIPRRPS
jgi:quercetin dioxygenase-like cupin family protein